MWVLEAAGISVGFAAPWLLAGLALLPVLWWLLRAVPPAPVRRRFAGIGLLAGLVERDAEAARTPWWLLALRMIVLAAVIVGFARPVLNPEPAAPGPRAPLLVVVENGWPAAADWGARIEALKGVLEAAARARRPVALIATSDPVAPEFLPADQVLERLPGLVPVAWRPAAEGLVAPLTAGLAGAAGVDSLWLSDGLADAGRGAVIALLEGAGRLQVLEPPAPRLGLLPLRFEAGAIVVSARASRPGAGRIEVRGFGPGPQGAERELTRLSLGFAPGSRRAEARLSLPPELRNRLTRLAISGAPSAGAVVLADDGLRRRRVGLIGPPGSREGPQLLSPLYYLRKALAPTAEILTGAPGDMIRAGADVIVLADVARLPAGEAEALAQWVRGGGLLLRFAGPHLAAADEGRGLDDPLLPVRLRAGGRVVGGAMSWGAPRRLAPFAPGSPFYGLAVPDEVRVRAQVLAEPGPDLAGATIAALADGTPLVTRREIGAGQVVLFHVTANAEWSDLPLSGLFVAMLERLAVSARAGGPAPGELAGTTWHPVQVLDGFGALAPPEQGRPVPGEVLAGGVGRDLAPGLYRSGARMLAVNVLGPDAELAPAQWPARLAPGWGARQPVRELAGWFWLAALLGLLADTLAALALSGRIGGAGRGRKKGGEKGRKKGRVGSVAVVLAGLLLLAAPPGARAQEEPREEPANEVPARVIDAAAQVTLAHVLTGDASLDAVARAGLVGLSDQLFARTSVEPAAPVGVDPAVDELSVYPLLYWPVSADQPLPPPAAYVRLNAYLRAGGMILFETRDANRAGTRAPTPEARRLRALAAPLDIPPLEPLPADHVLTRAFYLLDRFPGRHAGTVLWVEAAPPDAERAPGMPFRRLNDGVSPVVIGGGDWAAAWAVRGNGAPMFPVGRGAAGARQRELAYRFGVNLVMHVLTGNYKSDQVHVPALLQRLGQ